VTPADKARIREEARRSAAEAPPLRAEQRDRLSGLLRAAKARKRGAA
jgi:hypothetical protein